MVWRWFQDWRARRAILTEMEQLQARDEALLAGHNLNPFNLAKLTMASDPVEAASQWERARLLLPNTILKSKDSLEILLGLSRYDEAEALMRQRLKRFRGDGFGWVGLALIAERRRDTAETLKRWKAVRRHVRDTVEGYIGCAQCLSDLGRFDEAETQLKRALRRDPGNIGVRVWRARVSDRRKDWALSLTRWKELAETFDDVPAFAFVGKAMMEMGQYDAAEAYVAKAAHRHPSNFYLADTLAEIAAHRGDLDTACDRWATARASDPNGQTGYREGARRLIEAGRHAEADAVLRAAIERFPNEAWPARNFARLAHNQRDWNEAAARWEALRRSFPAEEDGYSLGAEALKQAGRAEDAAALHRAT
jgi:tetratricopeptide (TPR) repeat protein